MNETVKNEIRVKAGDEIICSEKVARTEKDIEESSGSTVNLLSLDQTLQYSCSLKKANEPSLAPIGNHDYILGDGSVTISKIIPPSSKNHAETVMIKFNKNGKCLSESEGKDSYMYCKTEMEFIDPKDLGTIDPKETIQEALMPSGRKGLAWPSKSILTEDYDPKETVIQCMTKRRRNKEKIIPMNTCIIRGISESGITWPGLKVVDDANRIDFSGNMSFHIMDAYTANKLRNWYEKFSKEEMKEWKKENPALSKSYYHLSAGWPLFIMIPEKSTDVTCKVHRFKSGRKVVAKDLKCINTPVVAQPRSAEKVIEALDIAAQKKSLFLKSLFLF